MVRQSKSRRITVEVLEHLLERARREGESLTEVVRNALELRTSQAWQRLAKWSGKVRWSISLGELRKD
jgi:hypothetical protein